MISNETLFHLPVSIGLGYMDDWMTLHGPTETNSYFVEDTGFSNGTMVNLQRAYYTTMDAFHHRVKELGGFTW